MGTRLENTQAALDGAIVENERLRAERDAAVRAYDEVCEDLGHAYHGIDLKVRDLARVTAERDEALAEVEAMRAVADDLAKLLKMHHVGHGAFDRKGCGVCKPIDAALDALRARKVGG
jgi:hypothetical protein